MSRPRVAFITNLCPHYRQPLYRLLAERFRVTFFFYSEREESYLSPAVRHEPGDLPVREVNRVVIGGHPVLTGLADELNNDNYDAVIKCINGRLMMPYVFQLAKRRRIPFVLWSGLWHHPTTLAHRLARPLVEGVYRRSDAIVVYGSHVKRFVTSVNGVSNEKIYVAGQAIDTSRFSGVIPEFGEPAAILFVGRFEVQKGLLDLLSAFSMVRDPAVRLRLVGSGRLEGEIRSQAARDPRVELLGHVPQAELGNQFARARAVVLPSVTTRTFREPWGLTANESMTAGLPVIATSAVGAAAGGLVKDERNGLVVPERDPIALAGAMGRLAADRQLAERLGSCAREDVEAFDYPRMVQAFVDAVDHAIEANGRGG